MIQEFLSRPAVFYTLLALLVLATLGLVVLAPALIPLPILAAAFVWVLCRAPVRTPTLILFFFSLAADAVKESPFEGAWKSPLNPIGRFLFQNIGKLIGAGSGGVPMLDVLVIGLLAIYVYRRSAGLKTDPEVVPLPGPQLVALGVLPLTILWMLAWGVAHGGKAKIAQWQFHQMMVLPLLVWLFNSAVRGPQDFRLVARIIVASCIIKAFLGAYFIEFIARPRGIYYEYATCHSDTMLYVTGLMIVITHYSEAPSRHSLWRMIIVSAIIFMGMSYNDRRLAYVSLVLALAAAYLLSPWTHAKRQVTRAAISLSPALPFYFVIGWSNPVGIFSLLKPFKSIIAGENAETLPGQMDYRDIENFDVVMTWKKNPLLGSGWGHPFDTPLALPDISKHFADFLYHPHNSVLGLLAFGGAVGLTGLWAHIVITQFLAARAYHRAHEPVQRAACLVAISVIVAYINQCFGDMGTISWIGTILLAMGITCAGKVATLTGAWPSSPGVHAPTPARPEAARIQGKPAGNAV